MEGTSVRTNSGGKYRTPSRTRSFPNRTCAILLTYGLFQKGRVLAQDRVNRQQQDVIDYLQEVYVAFVIDSPPFTARRQLRPRRHLACRDTQDGRSALARSRGAVLQRK